MCHMKELVSMCNIYIAEHTAPNAQLLGTVASYLTHLFKVFGVCGHDASIGFSVEGEQTVNKVKKARNLIRGREGGREGGKGERGGEGEGGID